MFQQFVELVMYLPLILVFFVLFLDLTLENFEEFGFKQHLLNSYENFQNHLKDLALGKLETYTIRNHYLIVDQLVTVQVD